MVYPANTGYSDNRIQSESATSGYAVIPVGPAYITRSCTSQKLLYLAASKYSGPRSGEDTLDLASGPTTLVQLRNYSMHPDEAACDPWQ